MSSWTNGDWMYEDGKLAPKRINCDYIEYDYTKLYEGFTAYDYYVSYPVTAPPVYYSINDVHSTITVYVDDIPHPDSTGYIRYELDKIYTCFWWNKVESYRVPCAHTDPKVLGAFAYCGLKNLNIPITIDKLGDFSFVKSDIENVVISPELIYNKDTTFPDSVNIEYCDVLTFEIVGNLQQTRYFLNEPFNVSGIIVNATITDEKTIKTINNTSNYSIYGYDNTNPGNQNVYVLYGSHLERIPDIITVLPYTKEMMNFKQSLICNRDVRVSLQNNVLTNCLSVLAVMHTGNIEVEGDWTLLLKSVSTAVSTQYISIYYKQQSGQTVEEVNVYQDIYNYICGKIINIYDPDVSAQNITLTVIENQTIASVPYSPRAKSGKRRLYFASSVETLDPDYDVVATNYDGLDLVTMSTQRFKAFYDYQPDIDVTPTITYQNGSGYISNSMNIIVIDIV